jgi:serine/threonine-protein kinase SRPK3
MRSSRRFSFAFFSKNRSPCRGHMTVASRQIPSDIPVDEEVIPGYDPKYFYHPNPGDILDGKYELKAKVGWGTSSTVWLAQDVRWKSGSPYVAIKINDCRLGNQKAALRELEISNQIVNAQSADDGRKVLRTIKDSFEVKSPNGIHVCFVMEPMREPLWILRRRFGADKITPACLPLFQTYIFILLGGLHYLHTECHVIHTGVHDSSVPR